MDLGSTDPGGNHPTAAASTPPLPRPHHSVQRPHHRSGPGAPPTPLDALHLPRPCTASLHRHMHQIFLSTQLIPAQWGRGVTRANVGSGAPGRGGPQEPGRVPSGQALRWAPAAIVAPRGCGILPRTTRSMPDGYHVIAHVTPCGPDQPAHSGAIAGRKLRRTHGGGPGGWLGGWVAGAPVAGWREGGAASE